MGATSATGVSGAGVAQKPGGGNKGSDAVSMAVHKLIGPRVVCAGSLQLEEETSGTVYYPTLVGDASDYICMVNNDSSTHAYFGNFSTSSFTVTAGSSDLVNWVVIKKGLWGSPTTDLANT